MAAIELSECKITVVCVCVCIYNISLSLCLYLYLYIYIYIYIERERERAPDGNFREFLSTLGDNLIWRLESEFLAEECKVK
jgi:hypothetical protein